MSRRHVVLEKAVCKDEARINSREGSSYQRVVFVEFALSSPKKKKKKKKKKIKFLSD